MVFASELGVNTLIAIALKKLFGYRILVNIDDSVPMALHCGGIREKLRRFVLHHIDGAVLVNPMVRDFLKQKYPKSKCKFIYFPIIQDDTKLSAKINCAKDKAEAYVQEHGLQGKQIVLFVGRLEQVKCPDMLLRAFHRTASEDSMLVMVGTGSLANGLKEAQEQYHDGKKVIFTGKLTGEDLYAWYYLADTFVLPSQFEPFGAVVNEALVAGCHTIVTENVGAECLINKENGSVIKANDEDALVKAIDESLSRGSTKRHESRMDHPFAWYFAKIVGFMDES